MAYNKNLVVAIKCNNKIMREKKDEVFLPFGSEYSIMIKNLNSRKALVNIWIDGEALFDFEKGSGLVVNPGKSVDLERFYKTNNKFKFIEKTKEISEYRGDRIDDGLIRVEYSFEREKIQIPIIDETHYPNETWKDWDKDWWTKPVPYYVGDPPNWLDHQVTCSNEPRLATRGTSLGYENKANIEDSELEESNAGITVKGSKSEQRFIDGYIGELESESHVIILNLKGCTSKKVKVAEPVTVNDKVVCETCGKHCNSKQNFCDRCGTALF